jgi:hypothetical protein
VGYVGVAGRGPAPAALGPHAIWTGTSEVTSILGCADTLGAIATRRASGSPGLHACCYLRTRIPPKRGERKWPGGIPTRDVDEQQLGGAVHMKDDGATVVETSSVTSNDRIGMYYRSMLGLVPYSSGVVTPKHNNASGHIRYG